MSTTPVAPKPQQTRQQIEEVYTSWKKPATLLPTSENGKIIATYMLKYFPNDWTHANLDRVVTHPEVAPQLKWERNQSPSEIRETFENWWQKTIQANPTLQMTPEVNTANRLKILTYVSKFYEGRISFPNLDASFEAVKDTLEYKAPPTPAELQAAAIKKAQELEARDLQRRLQEHRENLESEKNFVERRKAADKKIAEGDKAVIDEFKSKEVIESLIEGYQKNHSNIPGRIDYAGTESIKKALRAFRVHRGDKVDWVLTARALRDGLANGFIILDTKHGKERIEL
jgi:hypothetical protein